MCVLVRLTVLVGVLLLVAIEGMAIDCNGVFKHVKPTIGTTGAGYAGGQGSPAAQVPFGALRLGPDTTNNTLDLSYRHCSGYNWVDANIRAFSHTRLVNAGVDDLGNFGVMPTNRRSIKDDIKASLTSALWTSHYDKASEKAAPGSYSVYLDGVDVQADMVVHDKFAGVHRYTWNPTMAADKDTVPGLVIDICHAASKSLEDGGACLAADLTIDADRRTFSAEVVFKGSLSGRGDSNGLKMYLHGVLVSPDAAKPLELNEWLVCTGDKSCSVVMDRVKGGDGESKTFESTSGKLLSHVRFLSPDMKDATSSPSSSSSAPFVVELVVGLSFISQEQAKTNLQASLPARLKDHAPVNGVSYFDAVKASSKSQWCDALTRLDISDYDTTSSPSSPSVSHPTIPDIPFDKEEKDFLAIAYSAFYRTLLSPTQYSEEGGYYLGMDKKVHNSRTERAAMNLREVNGASSMDYFSDLSLWDTFRTQHPWLLLTRPDIAIGTLRSIGEMTGAANRFPKWVLASGESGCMIGIHGLAAVAEACSSGYGKEFDVATIQRVALQQSTNQSVTDRSDLQRYLTEGYVSLEASDVAASLTLSYAFDDYSLGVISDYVGDKTSADACYQRAGNYKNIWSKKQGIMCPKHEDGQLECPHDTTGPKSWSYYTEGDAEHWRWFVPHDIEGLISLFESKGDFENTLSLFFEKSLPYHDKLGEAAPNPYYWAGNEVDLLAPFMFNYANCTRTQFWTRQTLQMHYNSMAHGLPGNDDYGTMSANILFTSLGFYPLAGSTRFFISSPRVSRGTVCVGEYSSPSSSFCSRVVEVIAHNNSPDNVYVEKLLLNGVEVKSPFLERSLLVSGAKLEFFMTSTPKSGLCDSY